MLEIKYNNEEVINKHFLTPIQTKQQPKIYYNFNQNELYTLIMYDPDTPYGDYVHWLIINIKGNITNNETIIPYKGPAPPINTGVHRYIFLIYKQDTLIKNAHLKDVERNIKYSTLLNKLSIKTEPIEQIYFTSEYQSGGNKSNKNKINKSKKNNKSKKSKKNKTKKIKNKSI